MAKEYAKKFYASAAWRATRAAYLKHVGGICERCMKEFEQGKRKLEDVRPAAVVHHKRYITPATLNDPKVSLSWDNLEALCDDHHNKEHSAKGKRYVFDKEGNILEA